MATIVHITETAFLSILVSAIEAFPSKYEGRKKPRKSFPEGEVYGLLFGQSICKKSNDVYHASIAIPMQILSDRTPALVHPSSRHFERIRTVIQAYPMYQFLGTFHSHPYRKDEYRGIDSSDCTPVDEESAISAASSLGYEILEVIIGLTCLDKAMKKEPDSRWSCIQNYCGRYKYSLAAYATSTAEQRLREVDNLICPFAAGIGNYDLD
ncbi:MAG TPA: hypothetical protein PKM41_08445 [Deltaproteobacteria bacterium]|jgi:hypothetical protein|nr:hypothetical protein [Deltaproteobacteria bacterium]HOI07348.1 hypothetical protein [Deltaproteobacteria bacterium]